VPSPPWKRFGGLCGLCLGLGLASRRKNDVWDVFARDEVVIVSL
jgi:hypothetical protein